MKNNDVIDDAIELFHDTLQLKEGTPEHKMAVAGLDLLHRFLKDVSRTADALESLARCLGDGQ